MLLSHPLLESFGISESFALRLMPLPKDGHVLGLWSLIVSSTSGVLPQESSGPLILTPAVTFTKEIRHDFTSPLWHKRLITEWKGTYCHINCARPSTQGSPIRCKFSFKSLCVGLLALSPTIWGYRRFAYHLHRFA